MANTTSISDLPINPTMNENPNVVQENNIQNVKINNPIPEQNNFSIDNQKNYNQIITDIQQASISGQTGLPSRDIPQDTSQIVNDPAVKVNYIPEPRQVDYIDNDNTMQDIVEQQNQKMSIDNNLERLYEELQYPIIIAVLFFLFQLPAVQKYIYQIVPSLFNSDGNPNIYGYVLNSILFGTLFYIISKILTYFTNF